MLSTRPTAWVNEQSTSLDVYGFDPSSLRWLNWWLTFAKPFKTFQVSSKMLKRTKKNCLISWKLHQQNGPKGAFASILLESRSVFSSPLKHCCCLCDDFRQDSEIVKSIQKYVFKWAIPSRFLVYFQTSITTNRCKNISIQYLVLEFKPTTFRTWVGSRPFKNIFRTHSMDQTTAANSMGIIKVVVDQFFSSTLVEVTRYLEKERPSLD